jgi:hypothetical protein
MKTNLFYSMILAVGLIFAGSAVTLNAQTSTFTTKKTTTKTTMKPDVKKYTCPEHPDVVMNKAGKCPKCGMALVEKKMMKKEMMEKKTETTKKMKTTK